MKLDLEQIEPLLGVLSDSIIAKQFQVTRERVRQLRKERNIPKATNSFKKPTHQRTIDLLHNIESVKDLIGAIPDYKVAKKAGVTAYAIKQYRLAHNIKGWNHRKFDATKLVDIEKDLGKYPDHRVAKKYGVSRITIFRLRKEKNIPASGRLISH